MYVVCICVYMQCVRYVCSGVCFMCVWCMWYVCVCIFMPTCIYVETSGRPSVFYFIILYSVSFRQGLLLSLELGWNPDPTASTFDNAGVPGTQPHPSYGHAHLMATPSFYVGSGSSCSSSKCPYPGRYYSSPCFSFYRFVFPSSLNLSINYMKEGLYHFHRTPVLTRAPTSR